MKEIRFRIPVSETEVRSLELGDLVYLDGLVLTWRDMAFARAFELLDKGEKLPVNLQEAVHWHCGPITRKRGGRWEVVSAGSTTSLRFTDQESKAIREWGIRLVIGKGGMGRETVKAMNECGVAYLETVGGAASLYAKKIKEVKNVYWLDLGMPEAIWVFQVENFGPLLVTTDSKGNSLYEEVAKRINENRLKEYGKLQAQKEH
jgi:fumarate hydratase subunit beta